MGSHLSSKIRGSLELVGRRDDLQGTEMGEKQHSQKLREKGG